MSGIFDQIINYSPPLIVSGTVNYKGTWDASANSPTLNVSPAASTKGDYYVVSVAGTQFGITFAIGDWIISNGTAWEKVDLTDAVSSVFGRTGAVVGVSTDYSAVGITNTAIGASNPSTGAFTTVSASTPIAVASGGTGVSTSTGTTNVVLSNSPTIVTPVIAQINDASGNETLKLASIASAVNEISIENAATGNPVHIRATGGDASVGLHLVAKGASGYVNVTDGVDETKRIMFNAAGGTTNTRTMLSSTQTVDRTISLPDATGTLLYGGGPLGTPASGTVTNLTGTASININGTVGATTPAQGNFTFLFQGTAGAQGLGVGFSGAAGQGFSLRDTTNSRTYFFTTETSAGLQINAGANPISLIASSVAVTGALSASGAISSSGSQSNNIGAGGTGTGISQFVLNGGSGTNGGSNIAFNKNSVGKAIVGIDSCITGGTSDNLMNYVASGGTIRNYVGGTGDIGIFSSTGLAVTGALSSTTGANFATSSGSVGIGTSSPSVPLDIVTSNSDVDVTALKLTHRSGTLKVGTVLELGGASGSSNFVTRLIGYSQPNATYNTQFAIQTMNGAGSYVTGFTQDENGNVGIGTTSPAFPLDVNLGLVVRGSATRSGSGMFLANDSTYGLSINAVNHLVAGLPLAIMGYPIKFLSSETGGELARIDTSGNVGIGTTSPTRQLQVSNTSNAVISAINGSIEGVLNATTAGVNFGSASNHFVTLSTNGVERARIDTSGNLLVGTTSTIDIGKISLLFDASSQNGISVKSSSATYSNNLMSFVNAGGSQVGYIYTNGTITTYSGTSDYRLKDITGPLTDSGVFIDALKPKVGTWKSDGSKFVGFLAHEFAEVSPSSVNGEKDAVDAEGNPKYQGMQAGTAEVIANLVAELQSLRQRVAALESN